MSGFSAKEIYQRLLIENEGVAHTRFMARLMNILSSSSKVYHHESGYMVRTKDWEAGEFFAPMAEELLTLLGFTNYSSTGNPSSAMRLGFLERLDRTYSIIHLTKELRHPDPPMDSQGEIHIVDNGTRVYDVKFSYISSSAIKKEEIDAIIEKHISAVQK